MIGRSLQQSSGREDSGITKKLKGVRIDCHASSRVPVHEIECFRPYWFSLNSRIGKELPNLERLVRACSSFE